MTKRERANRNRFIHSPESGYSTTGNWFLSTRNQFMHPTETGLFTNRKLFYLTTRYWITLPQDHQKLVYSTTISHFYKQTKTGLTNHHKPAQYETWPVQYHVCFLLTSRNRFIYPQETGLFTHQKPVYLAIRNPSRTSYGSYWLAETGLFIHMKPVYSPTRFI